MLKPVVSLLFVLTPLVVLTSCVRTKKQSSLLHSEAEAVQSIKRRVAGDAAPSPEWVEEQLLRIAREYEGYSIADYQMHLTPIICDFSPSRLIVGTTPAGTFTSDLDVKITPSRSLAMSRSKSERTHGKKLYLVFATTEKPGAPVVLNRRAHPVGQVFVKEAWEPEEVAENGQELETVDRALHSPLIGGDGAERVVRISPIAHASGKFYRAGAKRGLFILFKLDPHTPGTDEGWLYGTVTADGKRVVSSGYVKSCVSCHSGAPYDHVFGPGKE